MLKPLGTRLIVKPDPPDTESAGGILFPQTRGVPPRTRGQRPTVRKTAVNTRPKDRSEDP